MTPASKGQRESAASSDRPFTVEICDRQQAVAVDPDWLLRIAESVLAGEGVVSAEISVALVDDATIHEVNRRFLRHDYPTDVISFMLSAPDPDALIERKGEGDVPLSLEGEVVVSGETARRSADELNCKPVHELALYLIHGLLHLCGYDDRSPNDRERMRQRERRHLQNLGLPSHY